MAAITPFISLSAICWNQPLINFPASAFKPASSAGHDAETVVAAAEVGAAGAVVCANSGAHKTTDAMNEAAQNNLQMRLVFMRTLYQIQLNALRAHASCDGESFTHLKYGSFISVSDRIAAIHCMSAFKMADHNQQLQFKVESPTRHRRQELQDARHGA